MKVKRPSKIKIGNHIIPVRWRKDVSGHGKFSSDPLHICIRNTDPISLQKEVFVHECLHAIYFFSGLASRKSCSEEVIIDSITSRLLEFMQTNPVALSWLLSEPINEKL